MPPVRASKLLPPDLEQALRDEPEALAETLLTLHIEDLAELVAELRPTLVVQLMQVLPLELAADLLSRMPEQVSRPTLESLSPQRAANVLTEVEPDDRADLVQELPDEAREQILDRMELRQPGLADELRTLSAYAPNTAGGIMTPSFVALGAGLNVGQATEEVRRLVREQHQELIYYVYVVAYDKLVGVISLRDLILSENDRPISEVMTTNIVHVAPSLDQEEVAKMMAKYDLLAIPVVDADRHMLGVVTNDDVVDVMVEEATEDAQKMAAVVPTAEAYFQNSFVAVVRSRVTWLVALFLGELLTANVMHHYETQMANVIDLVLFIPLIISSGGNSGSQSSSLVIRALALGEMFPADWRRVVSRELLVGLALGAVLGVLGFLRALAGTMLGWNTAAPWSLAFAVAFSVLAVVVLGTMIGSVMPLVIRRMGIDPALASTPFVASLVDVLGLVVYFTVARIVLAL